MQIVCDATIAKRDTNCACVCVCGVRELKGVARAVLTTRQNQPGERNPAVSVRPINITINPSTWEKSGTIYERFFREPIAS